MEFVIWLIIIVGIFVLLYWKIPGFRTWFKKLGSSGNTAVNPKDIERMNDRLKREVERTAQLKEWADIQTKINAERAQQAASRKIIEGGRK